MSRCTHTPRAKATRYGGDRCANCSKPIVPVICQRCDGEGEIWTKANGWHECPDCNVGVLRWDPEADE